MSKRNVETVRKPEYWESRAAKADVLLSEAVNGIDDMLAWAAWVRRTREFLKEENK